MASKKILEKNPASGPKSFTGPRARAQDEVPESGPRPTVDDMSDSEISIPKATKAELEISGSAPTVYGSIDRNDTFIYLEQSENDDEFGTKGYSFGLQITED